MQKPVPDSGFRVSGSRAPGPGLRVPGSGIPVLVTGGSGFLGGRLVRRLDEAGYLVHVLDLGKGQGRAPGVVWHRGSILDPASIARAVALARPSFVFHLAAQLDRAADDIFSVNVLGTYSVLRALRGSSARRMVLASSCEVYGAEPAPWRESQRCRPRSDYAKSKLAAEAAAFAEGGRSGIAVTALRFSVLYGPGQRENGMFIPSIAAAARAGKPFPMTGGRQVRDFLHADDAVEAMLAAARSPKAANRVLNIGYGRSVSLATAARLAERLVGRRFVRLGAHPYRTEEMFDYRVNTTVARRLLHWKPRISLQKGMSELLGGAS